MKEKLNKVFKEVFGYDSEHGHVGSTHVTVSALYAVISGLGVEENEPQRDDLSPE